MEDNIAVLEATNKIEKLRDMISLNHSLLSRVRSLVRSLFFFFLHVQ